MEIVEFDIPILIMPKEPYWFDDISTVIFSSKTKMPPSDYWRPKHYTRLIIYKTDIEFVKKILTNFITFSNLLNKNSSAVLWHQDISLNNIEKYKKSIEDIHEYVANESIEPKWHFEANYDQYPLSEISPQPSKISFKDYFLKYVNVNDQDKTAFKIKNLINFFAAVNISKDILKNVYANSNLHINNYFIIIETLINMDLETQSGYEICPHCEKKIRKKKKKMTDLIDEYVKMRVKENEEIQEIISSILKTHYSTRNIFSHNAKYDEAVERIKIMIQKLRSNSFTLNDEIKYAGASHLGLNIIESFIRIELLNKLIDHNCNT